MVFQLGDFKLDISGLSQEQAQQLAKEMNRLTTDNQRLRAALEPIVDKWQDSISGFGQTVIDAIEISFPTELLKQAAAAIKEGDDEAQKVE